MFQFSLKCSCNPNQKPTRIYMAYEYYLPITIYNCRSGSPWKVGMTGLPSQT